MFNQHSLKLDTLQDSCFALNLEPVSLWTEKIACSILFREHSWVPKCNELINLKGALCQTVDSKVSEFQVSPDVLSSYYYTL